MVSSSTNANVHGTRSMPPRELRVARRATRAATTSARLGFFGKSKNSLADDVALDLGCASPDRLGSREEERGLQDRHGVVGAAVPATVTGDELFFVRDAPGEDLRVRPE